ncbi:ECF transporter S component, partial [Candidatus Bathyarchaeota archaeon]|nr:ECF transporter S component [Candidatus Bathyarchaeota archaeon]
MRKEKNSVSVAINLATAVVFAAFVTVATIIFTVSIPATSGYFNIGETVIYVAALLFGPYVGAFAGGIGSAIADMLLAPVYAPGTFIVKSLEGAIVGILNRKMSMHPSHSKWKIFTFSLGIIIGVSLAITGSFYYSGNVELYVGIPPPENPTL